MLYTVQVNKSGTFWYKEGTKKLHRFHGPAVERKDGLKEYWVDGQLHREDGPAVEYSNGDKVWYLNGKRHREDGPAIENSYGDKLWYLNGKQYSKEEWERAVKLYCNKTVVIDGQRYKLVPVED